MLMSGAKIVGTKIIMGLPMMVLLGSMMINIELSGVGLGHTVQQGCFQFFGLGLGILINTSTWDFA